MRSLPFGVLTFVVVFGAVHLIQSPPASGTEPHARLTGQYVDGALNASGVSTKIFVETAGDPANPAIVFLHGLAINRLAFDKQFSDAHAVAGKGRRLIDHYFLVRMDQRGHGLSDKPTEQSEYLDGRKWADDVNAVITTLGLDRPILVATSFGGRSLMLYVQHYGQSNLSGIVLVGAAQGVAGAGTPLNARLTGLQGIANADAETNIAAVNELQRATTLAAQPEADFYRAVGARMQCPVYVRVAIDAARGGPFAAIVRSLAVPVLIIQGAQDALFRAPFTADTLASMITLAPVTKLIYENCGHSAQVEQPERFNHDLDEFASVVFGASQ